MEDGACERGDLTAALRALELLASPELPIQAATGTHRLIPGVEDELEAGVIRGELLAERADAVFGRLHQLSVPLIMS